MEKMTPICSRPSLMRILPVGKGAFVRESHLRNWGTPPSTAFPQFKQVSHRLRRNLKICKGSRFTDNN